MRRFRAAAQKNIDKKGLYLACLSLLDKHNPQVIEPVSSVSGMGLVSLHRGRHK